YAPADSRIEVSLAKAQGQWQLRLGNAAPDLTEADLPYLGQRFWRKSSAREATLHGGLGLALAGTLAGVLSTALRYELREGVLWVTLGPLPDIDSIKA
ncbi:MAG: sensor histidine kinase, partial [Dyella sp.]|nr:sensor histidine kinase [Dyella sp.]